MAEGGNGVHGGDGPIRRRDRLPTTRGRGGGRSKPLCTAQNRPKMKRLFPDDEEVWNDLP